MATYMAKKVGRKVAGNKIAAYEPADPHYETYTDAKGKQRNRKRAMPAGLSKRDERILRSVRRRAHYLDKGFSICGFRFGWTAILGLIPFAGDIASFLLGYFLVLKKCRQAELPASLSSRMAFNQTVGLGIGLTPLVGDIAAAVFKANSRNAALLEEFLIQRSKQQSEGNTAAEAAAADSVLQSTRISGKSGEAIGSSAGAGAGAGSVHATAGGSTAVAGGSGEINAPASTMRAQNNNSNTAPTAPRKNYGWGKDNQLQGPASETTPLTNKP